MISYKKDLWGHIEATGFATVEEAEADIERLRGIYEAGYGFNVSYVHPSKRPATPFVAEEPGGTFSFKYWRGDSCD
jgi:hypothetical protein